MEDWDLSDRKFKTPTELYYFKRKNARSKT